MEYRALASTGIQVSRLAFGAGPVPALMTGDAADVQRRVVRRALDAGINWFDTAATYGQGRSESGLGAALRELGAGDAVHVATKVRLEPEELDDIPARVRASVAGSLDRLGLRRITLLQLHNSITARRGDQPTSLTRADVLGPGGVLEAFRQLQAEGLVTHLGLTALGQPAAMREVIQSGAFVAVQVPYNLLNPSAGRAVAADFAEADYGNVIAACAAGNLGVLAIRVFAGGALAGQPPSRHTYKTRFFPLDLYHRDQQRRRQLEQRLPAGCDVKEVALRFVLSHPQITAAIVGFGDVRHVDDAVAYADAGPLSEEILPALAPA